MRYLVRRPVLFILFLATASLPICGHAQTPADSPTNQDQQASSPSPASPAPSEEVAAAEASIAKSDWKAAETQLAAWLTAHAGDARALFDAGYVADAQNKMDDAAGFYRRAVTADPRSFEAHLSLGLLLARQGKLAEARTELAASTALDPGEAGPAIEARAWRAMAQIDRSSNPADASNDLLEALKLSPETPDDTLLAAELAQGAGQYDTAEAAYRRLLAKDPKSTPANAGLVHLFIARKQYPEAETLVRTALQQAPDDPTLTAQLATVLAAQDKPEAVPLLQKLHDAHPNDAAITRMLADLLAESGDASGSDHLYAPLLAAHPDDPVLLIAHGQNLIRQLKYADAFQIFTKATELEASNADGWSGLAFAASKFGRPAITLHALTMRSKYLAEIPATYFLWATSYDSLHEKAAAISYYHHFLEAAAGKFPDQEWQARQRLLVLEKKQ
jgi:predicted Zn-dependent protease